MECWLSLRGQHEAETHTPSGPWYEIKDGLRRPPTSDSLWACQHLSWGHCPHPLYPLPSCTLCTSPRGLGVRVGGRWTMRAALVGLQCPLQAKGCQHTSKPGW